MKATFEDQLRLLDLARLDEDLRRADVAKKNPAQATRIKELLAQRAAQSTELTRLRGGRDDAQTELSRIESDVAVVDARSARDAERLAVAKNPKDAQALEHEIASLARRKSDLEDAELAVMERLETLDAAIAEQEGVIAALNDEGTKLSTESASAVAGATNRYDEAARDRAAVAASLPDPLVALYDRIAGRGVGAGLLQHRTCGACRMVLSGTDLNVLRAAAEDDVVTCPECGCILVRDNDSGL
ncbi:MULTISPECIES: zinc ribbon domain-containing protein [unclassified Microbacterium]|uniref:zinc ribbon domain-containing protein n=1 Tax=unclassified Microbacterium TaxID=2609290 RepID=UPI00386E1E2C